ncbi:MAG TPA: hypothetical protein VGZ91_17930 [Candidatus Sulfotelmatobacter sp.]|jgi:hypothetical protein|nr:hypothetical protein [Candidatus Sulfotelmatobacter sp.]
MTPRKLQLRTSTNRTPLQLNSKLNSNLITYATAASATGVAFLALAPSASAEVVFTPANATIGPGGSYLLDLNHDGTVDFTLHRCRCLGGPSGHSTQLQANIDGTGNGVLVEALSAGKLIGRGQRFTTVNGYYGGPSLAQAFYYAGLSRFSGAFANATNKFLGVEFKIDGQIHYGWARLTVTNFNHGGTATLTGYAYETLPNHPIRAGQRSETADNTPAAPALSAPTATTLTLGLLALGSDAFAPWRREHTLTTNQTV